MWKPFRKFVQPSEETFGHSVARVRLPSGVLREDPAPAEKRGEFVDGKASNSKTIILVGNFTT